MNVHDALHKVQKELPEVPRDKENPHFRSKYASLEGLMEKVLPVLNDNDLVWTTKPGGTADDPELAYELRLIGEDAPRVILAIQGTMPLLLQKRDPQGLGSAITYGRRYCLEAVLGIVAEEDDDGNAASGSGAKPTRRKAKTRPRPPKASDGTVKTVLKIVVERPVAADAAKMALTACGGSVAEGERFSAAVKKLTEPQAKALADMLGK